MEYYLSGVTAGAIFSPAFQTPSQTNVTYSTPVCYFTTGVGNKSIDVYTGVTSSFAKVKTSTTTISRVTSNSNPGLSKYTTISKNDVMVLNGRVAISTDESKDGNLAENWFAVGSMTVRYK
jgi:hypothetical protein